MLIGSLLPKYIRSMTITFPAVYSTLAPASLGELIAERYALYGAKSGLLERGVGDTYLIEGSSESFILKVHRYGHRTMGQVSAEVDLLFALQRASVSVAYPIADVAGHAIQVINAIEGDRYAVLFKYAPGTSVKVLNDEQLQALGHEMARFHHVSSTLPLASGRWTFDTDTTLFTPLNRLKGYFDTLPEEYAWLEDAAAQVAQRLRIVDEATLSAGYCHFDFLPKNFHFDSNNKITLFDFDFMGYGWLVNDIMTYWQHLQLDVYAGRMKKETADHMYAVFIDAYRSQRSLTEEELQLVPYLALGFWLFYMGFHTTHDQFSVFLQAPTLKAYTGFLQHLSKQYWSV